MSAHPYLDHPTPLAFAHRGGAGDWPENTMPAFESAVALGYRYLETDVHATADGVLVAFHDDRLERVTDREGLIRELPHREVRAARVGGREPIPLLEELLEAFPDARVNVDCKHDTAVEPLVRVLRRFDAADRVCVAAFSERRLRQLRALLGPDVATAAGPREVARLRLTPPGVPTATPRSLCLQVPPAWGRLRIVTPRLLERAHDLGLQVHVWTIDDPAEMERLLDLGVDGIMTDRPGVLRELLARRGQWPG